MTVLVQVRVSPTQLVLQGTEEFWYAVFEYPVATVPHGVPVQLQLATLQLEFV